MFTLAPSWLPSLYVNHTMESLLYEIVYEVIHCFLFESARPLVKIPVTKVAGPKSNCSH